MIELALDKIVIDCPTCGTKVTLAARDKNQDLAWE
ncbi:hypothetical protein PBI_SHRIMP_194 [Mycobacterium phage Shrimp]|uniref:Lysine biosynthesis protein LysW n=1 Tax=Mycobacterium phage Shrimp TaxID=1340835 RepID=T2FJ01_9CAUD|nr:hypothetical protein PBI_SHRIMP_194 [Mycobacterium phage Shrimp]